MKKENINKTWNYIKTINMIILSVIAYLYTDYSQNNEIFKKMNWTALIIAVCAAGLYYWFYYSTKKSLHIEIMKDVDIKDNVDFILNSFKGNNQINQAICKEMINDKIKEIGIRKTAETLYDYHGKYGIQVSFWKQYFGQNDNIELLNEIDKVSLEKELEKHNNK